MEEALGAGGHGLLEEHDALIGLVTDQLQDGEAAGRHHVEMLPADRGYDEAFCWGHVDVLPCEEMRIDVATMNIKGPLPLARSARARFDALVPRQRALLQRRVLCVLPLRHRL